MRSIPFGVNNDIAVTFARMVSMVSTRRLLTVCKMLLLVSVVAVVSQAVRGQRSEVGGQRLESTAENSGRVSQLSVPPVTRSLGLPVLTKPAGQVDAQLNAEAIQALLREVDARHEAANAKLERYSYILKRTEHQLNDQGVGTKYRVHEFRVFPMRQGLAIAAMLSENGQELSPEKLAKEKARANKEWQKHKKERPKKSDSKTVPWFETLDFTVLPTERLEDRNVMVLGFRPRSDAPPKKDADKFMSDLKGQVWIDPKEKMILKFHGELTTGFSAGGLSGWLSSLKPGTEITIENMRLPDGRWVVKLVEFSSIAKTRGPLWLPHTDRFRLVDEMSDYRPFDPEATDLFLK